MSAAILSPALAVVALVVGWFVLGTQRVTEELTKERRLAYAEVLRQARVRKSGRKGDAAFEEAIRKAHFLSSSSMYRARRLPALLESVGTDRWASELQWFTELARFETQRNSSLLRRIRRMRYFEHP
ncbi:MAG TPA: hypothetical protein VHW64_04435 [Nocardioides sp.]|jgi:hypothetical protein|uniref:hypothetical protein n=1 Tax=Nocardioides sp. TaxID=35761 RepID=UPI002E34C962|nr:hypothetical protein [Nocardioides sp.]HEX3929925.1 hypothetical protein [Nocardioides sp.]